MKDNIYKKAIIHLPMFFETQLQFDPFGAGIFEPLKKIINFDEAYIFFLNPDSISLKYLFTPQRNLAVNDLFNIGEEIKKDLFLTSNKMFTNDNKLVKLLNLEHNKSFLTLKLIIKNAVYGFILLCKKEKDYYTREEIEISSSVSSVISYKIKDVELFDIFKIQLRALKDGIIKTKEAYKTIKQQNLKIIEADRVKNEFLANISHELRTPLNAVIGFSEVLSNQLFGDLNKKQLEYVNDIYVSGIHLLGMINEILDLSKIEAKAMTLQRSEFLISRAVEEVLNTIKPLLSQKLINIEKEIIKDETIFADFQKIKQILYNLLSNAIKFTSKGGNIKVKVSFKDKNMLIKVKDSGIGIAQKDQSRIFQKFVQLENSYTKTESSTGLGLTITKELVKMHNGEILLKSTLGKGAEFTVVIPLFTPDEIKKIEELKKIERQKRKLARKAKFNKN